MSYFERQQEFEMHDFSIHYFEGKYKSITTALELYNELNLDHAALNDYETKGKSVSESWARAREYVRAFNWYTNSDRSMVPATFDGKRFANHYFETIKIILKKIEE